MAVRGWRTRDTGLTLKDERFGLDRWKMVFTKRRVKQWHRLPGEVVQSPALDAHG